MNFRRSLPEIPCVIIYWTTTIPHHDRPSPHPFQEMYAAFGSCELLGDVHEVHVCGLYGPAPGPQDSLRLGHRLLTRAARFRATTVRECCPPQAHVITRSET